MIFTLRWGDVEMGGEEGHMYVCMYIYMYLYVCMYVHMYVCMYVTGKYAESYTSKKMC